MNDLEFGTIRLHLDELMKERNISISKLSYRAEMQRTQLKIKVLLTEKQVLAYTKMVNL